MYHIKNTYDDKNYSQGPGRDSTRRANSHDSDAHDSSPRINSNYLTQIISIEIIIFFVFLRYILIHTLI